MTDSDPEPLDHLDDLASALLDGEIDRAAATNALDDATRADLDDRIRDLSHLRDRVAVRPDPPSEEIRDRMIARAISVGTADHEAPAPVPSAAVAPVRSLDQHRVRRSARLRRLAPVAVAAAVLLLGAIVLPSVLDGGQDDLASSFDDEGADPADTAGGEAEAATAPATSSAGADAMADETGVSEEGITNADRAADTAAAEPQTAEAEDAPALSLPSLAVGSEESESFADGETSDDELLDAIIRFRSSSPPADPAVGRQLLRAMCGDLVRHPADLVVEGSYQSQVALFVVDVDGSAVLAVTVLSPTCEILAQVSAN